MQQDESKEPKRAAILQAAVKLFAGRRFDEVKLDEIAAAAGVGKGTLYLYFKNKEELFAQMAVDGVDEMAARIREISDMPVPYKERLFRFGSDFSTFLRRRQGVMRALSQVQSDPVDRIFRKHMDGMIAAIHDMLQKGIDEGALRRDIRPPELRCALVGPLLLKDRREAHVGEKIELNALLELFWSAAHGAEK